MARAGGQAANDHHAAAHPRPSGVVAHHADLALLAHIETPRFVGYPVGRVQSVQQADHTRGRRTTAPVEQHREAAPVALCNQHIAPGTQGHEAWTR